MTMEETVPGLACAAGSLFSEQGMPVCPEGQRERVSMRCLQIGQKARIASVRAEGELGRRIRDMGLVPGVEVEVVGRAPLRDPVALRLPGFTLSLRNNEADHIVVDLLDGNNGNNGQYE